MAHSYSSTPIIQNNEVLRIVMVGKTGIGKSATGNTILGRKCFESKFSSKSMTVHCFKGSGEVDGQQVAVIDTPGLFDTRFTEDETKKEIGQCVCYAAPGPHVFLVVIRLGRYTEEEMQTVQKIQQMFGQHADKYSMVLFTHGDLLEDEDTTIEEFLSGSSELQELVRRCNGQYHVFNNKLKGHSQVTKLITKIRNIVQSNGGSHYTTEMFQEAERKIEAEKQRILRENEEKIRREKEELEKQLQEKYKKELKKIKEQAEAERKKIEEERRREREETKREREKREEEERRQKQKNDDDMKNMMQKLQEQHEREVREAKEQLANSYEQEARKKAEASNPLYPRA